MSATAWPGWLTIPTAPLISPFLLGGSDGEPLFGP